MTIEIQPVQSRQDREEFIRFPFRLYRGDPNWVPPLLSERRAFLDPKHNPFYAHADVALWLARRDGEVVGTISSHVDHRHNEFHDERVGWFGFFEAVNDYTVAERLLGTARDWVRQRGMSALRGPFSFSFGDPLGLVVDGEPQTPMLMMSYTPRRYAEFCERFGMVKHMDLYEYRLDLTQFGRGVTRSSAPLLDVVDKVREHTRVTLRSATRQSHVQDLKQAKRVFDQALARIWGFVPMTDAEYDCMIARLEPIIDPDLAIGAERDGEMVGIALVVPDANQLLKHLNGRLFPFGWLQALWLKQRGVINQARFILLGVLEHYRQQGIEALLIAKVLRVAALKGYQSIAFGWVAENNRVVNQMIGYWGREYGVQRTQTYRVYEMAV